MRALRLFPRLTAHACAALLLLSSVPGGGLAQRRRTPPRTRPRASAPAPRANATPTARPADAAPRAGAAQTPTPAPAPAPHAQPQQARRPEPDPAFEELLAADAYTVYAELRRVGTLSQTEEVKSAVAALTLLGGPEARPLTDFYSFVSDNREVLGESRIVIAFMPARGGVPQGVAAFELESPAAAVAFEPKLRRIIGEQVREVKKAMGEQPAPPDPGVAQRRRGQRPGAKVPGSDFAIRRVGRWLISSDGPFKLRQLRGEEGEPSLADSARFQSVRSRFVNDALFVYVDTDVAQRAWALQLQKIEEDNPAPEGATDTTAVVADVGGSGVVLRAETTPPGGPSPEPTPAADATPDPNAPREDPDPRPGEEGPPAEAGRAGGEAAPEEAPPPPPSAEEVAVRGLERVLRNLWGGVPRIPGAVALGLGLDRGALAVRLAVESTPEGTIALIPFLPNIVSGPPVTAESAAVAPADAELFVAGSLNWEHVYNSTLGAASVNPAGLMAAVNMRGDDPEDGEKAEREPSADETIAAVEKLFGFKFKEELLPSLGNEVALSMPLDARDFGIGSRGPRAGAPEEEKERDAEAGPVFIASLNDTAKMREILPRVFVALGFVSPGVAQAAPEKREGYEIRTLGAAGGISYAIVNNFLLVGELKAVRHCIDSFASRRTLAASNDYRDATSWQAKQKLVHIFVSDAIVRRVVDDAKASSSGSTDPVVRALLAQLEAAEFAPASYEATNEGDVLLHEMRLPLSLVKTYATTVAVAVKDAPVIAGEAAAAYTLQRISSAELTYRNEKKKERFATLEELLAEGVLEKDFLEHVEYKIELTATSDKFEATATPKVYGRSGRRSFYIDQTEVLRAADRRGERATADDPKTEQ
ncbi:MAG TPA: hypothetical protein VF659_04370 [Pyrinomonadaceae bacterium]|jgi:hypothetical protein